jgi:hypothetical protein
MVLNVNICMATYYECRVKKNPQYYGFPNTMSYEELEDALRQMCLK